MGAPVRAPGNGCDCWPTGGLRALRRAYRGLSGQKALRGSQGAQWAVIVTSTVERQSDACHQPWLVAQATSAARNESRG